MYVGPNSTGETMHEQSFEQTEDHRPHFQKSDALGPQYREADHICSTLGAHAMPRTVPVLTWWRQVHHMLGE